MAPPAEGQGQSKSIQATATEIEIVCFECKELLLFLKANPLCIKVGFGVEVAIPCPRCKTRTTINFDDWVNLFMQINRDGKGDVPGF